MGVVNPTFYQVICETTATFERYQGSVELAGACSSLNLAGTRPSLRYQRQ